MPRPASISDGRIVAAAEEERFRRVKHWAGFPSEAVKWCLAEAGVGLDAIDHVALNQDTGANLLKRAQYIVRSRPDVKLILERLRNRQARASAKELLEDAMPGPPFMGKVHGIEHHLAHLSSAFHVSPFEEAVCVSVDGFGDFASAAWGVGRGGDAGDRRAGLFPALAGHLLSGADPVSRLSALRRRIQGHGARALRGAHVPGPMRRIVRLEADGTFALDLAYLPPPPRADRLSVGRRIARPSATFSLPNWRTCSGRGDAATIPLTQTP